MPLIGITVLLIIMVMVWQHRTEQRLALPARPVWDSDRSPFPGLEAFTEQDSAVFFGRDAEITELLERLHPVVAAQANRLVAVVGPSGAGKSSLVQAGVVPRLRQRRGGWLVVPPVIPGDHPLRSLAHSVAASGSGHPTDDGVQAPRFADELRTAHGRPSAPVLLIVDQAEELITLSGAAERNDFLGLLASTLDADPRLWIIMIMRSEFLTAFLGTEQARLFRDPVAVGTLSRGALVEVIEEPARRTGLTFDPPTLPQRMATDAGGGDALPLLAYALQELGVAWSPDGRRLATASEDRTVRIWDTESGVEIIVVGAHAKGVESVSWSPDGRRVASASQDGTTRVWDATISVEQLVANAHRRVSRELTAEERSNLMLPPTVG